MLELPTEADIVIIGGGITGCSMAYYLSKGGMKVVLVELGSICSGASGRMMGSEMQVNGRDLNVSRVKLWSKYTFTNHELLKGLEEELGIDMEYRHTGGLDIANSDKDWEDVKYCYDAAKETGDKEIEICDPQEARERFIWSLGGIVKGVRHRPSDGQLSPFELTYGYVRGALKYGTKIFTETKATEIIKKGSKAIGVKTNRGTIYANSWVINATNAWSKELTPELDVIPCKGIVGITEQVPQDTLIPFESTVDGVFVYGTQGKTGNLIFGSSGDKVTEEGHFDEDVTYSDLKTTISKFTQIIPLFKDVSVLRVWAGAQAFTADLMPFIGPVPETENMFINSGYYNGIPWCPICSKLASEYILNDKKTSLPMEPFDPVRFEGIKHDWPKVYDYLSLEKTISIWMD